MPSRAGPQSGVKCRVRRKASSAVLNLPSPEQALRQAQPDIWRPIRVHLQRLHMACCDASCRSYTTAQLCLAPAQEYEAVNH